jgi:hypothetical protein
MGLGPTASCTRCWVIGKVQGAYCCCMIVLEGEGGRWWLIVLKLWIEKPHK